MEGKIVFQAPRCAAYGLVKDYCGLSGTGPNHDGMCIFLSGQQPFELAVETPRQPPLCEIVPASDGLKFCPRVEEEPMPHKLPNPL
jgi:hypothetical protein